MKYSFTTPFIIVSFFFAALLIPATALAEDWEYVSSSEGVEVYERDAQTMNGIAFRGVIETDIHIGKVISVFIDPDEQQHWVYRYKEQELIERDEPVGNTWSERYWVRVDMPFPTTDRDYVFHTDYEFDADEQTVTAAIRSVDDPRKPEQDCCVRAESITHYTVEALPGERTRIEVIVETDLKGNIPRRLTRSGQREWPVETLSALVERARADEISIEPRVQDWHD